MFHLLLGLPMLVVALILLCIIISVFLFGLVTFIASLVGGAWAAYFLKDKNVRKLVFIGFSTLAFIGLFPVVPIIAAFLGASPDHIIALGEIMTVCISIFSVVGIKLSLGIGNKYARIIISACFAIALILSLFFGILALVTLL